MNKSTCSTFATYHPAINFGFFCAVIGIGMFMIQPIFLIIGIGGALTYGVITGGKGTAKFALCFLLPVIAIVTIINPIVNRQGMTVLLETDHLHITLEATLYGFMLGLMLASILLWFASYNKVMTTDKFVYLFGRIMPAISLIFSMVMRFIPNYKMQITKISEAQKCIGRDAKTGTMKERVHQGIKIISIMFTWALENSIDSADSMRSRGYGLKNRSTFSIYRFDRRDGIAAAFLILMTAVVLTGTLTGACHMDFYPEIIWPGANGSSKGLAYAAYAAFTCICFYPVAVEVKEALIWQRLQHLK